MSITINKCLAVEDHIWFPVHIEFLKGGGTVEKLWCRTCGCLGQKKNGKFVEIGVPDEFVLVPDSLFSEV